jgi:hypothetical protein
MREGNLNRKWVYAAAAAHTHSGRFLVLFYRKSTVCFPD